MKIPKWYVTALAFILVEFLQCSLLTDPFGNPPAGQEAHVSTGVTGHVDGATLLLPSVPKPMYSMYWEQSTIEEPLAEDVYDILRDGAPSSQGVLSNLVPGPSLQEVLLF